MSDKIPDPIEPEFIKKAAETTIEGIEKTALQLVEDPMSVVESMAQSFTDTAEEEGIAFVTGGAIPSLIPFGAALKGAKVAGSLGKLVPDSKSGKETGKSAEIDDNLSKAEADPAKAANGPSKIDETAGKANDDNQDKVDQSQPKGVDFPPIVDIPAKVDNSLPEVNKVNNNEKIDGNLIRTENNIRNWSDEEILLELNTELKKELESYIKRFNNGEITRKQMGPAIAGVYNKNTNKYYFGINDPYGELPDVLHPYIKDRIDNMPSEVRQSYIKTPRGEDGAGSHAECLALNDSLLDDIAVSSGIDRNKLTQEMVDEVYKKGDVPFNLENQYVDVLNLKTFKTIPETGMHMPRCNHCEYITDGINVPQELLDAEYLKKVRDD